MRLGPLPRWIVTCLARARGHLLAALPPAALPALAHGLAWLDRARGAPGWQRAQEAWRLAFATRQPGRAPLLRSACAQAWRDRLEALRQRPGGRAALGPGPPAGPLYLAARLGRPRSLARLARRRGLRLASLEGVPQHAAHAAPTTWLGQPALRSTRRIARALARGQEVRLLLCLPGLAWHATPDLARGAAGPGEVLQRALDAQALLARARPDLVDWSQPRGCLRASLSRSGLASWTRLAPWAARRPRHAGRRARPAAPAARGRRAA